MREPDTVSCVRGKLRTQPMQTSKPVRRPGFAGKISWRNNGQSRLQSDHRVKAVNCCANPENRHWFEPERTDFRTPRGMDSVRFRRAYPKAVLAAKRCIVSNFDESRPHSRIRQPG